MKSPRWTAESAEVLANYKGDRYDERLTQQKRLGDLFVFKNGRCLQKGRVVN